MCFLACERAKTEQLVPKVVLLIEKFQRKVERASRLSLELIIYIDMNYVFHKDQSI